MKKENKRVFLTKQLLRNALMELLKTRHIDRISVKELCDSAYVNRSTFYRYYTLPKDILLEIELEFFEKIHITKPFECLEDVREYLKQGLGYFYENADTVRILLRNTTPDDYTGLMEDFAKQLVQLNDAQDVSPQKLRLVLAYMGAGSFCAIRQWLEDEKPMHPDELVDFTMDLAEQCLRAIS